MENTIKICCINDKYKPIRKSEWDAWFDICCRGEYTIEPHSRMLIETWVKLMMPKEYYAFITPRSSLLPKKWLEVANGVIDSWYRGECKVSVVNNTDEEIKLEDWERIAQFIFQKYESNVEYLNSVNYGVFDTLSPSDRGEWGFGSTGNL